MINKMNKKGFVITGIIILAFVVVIAVLAFLFSTTLRFVLIGGSIFVGGFIYLINVARSGRSINQQDIILMLLFFVFGGIVIAVPYLGLVGQTIFSVDTVTSFNANEDRLIITATPDSENAIVNLDKDDLNERLSVNGLTIDKGVRIEMSLVKFNEVYTLLKEETQIFYELEETDTGNVPIFDSSEARDLCIGRGITSSDYYDYYVREEPGLGLDNLICLTKNGLGTRAQLTGERFDDFDVLIKVGTEEQHITRNNQVVELANGEIKVSFEGELSAPQGIIQVPFDILFADSTYKHLISTSSANFAGIDRLNSFWINCISGANKDNGDGGNQINNCIVGGSGWNSEINNVLDNKNSQFAPTLVDNINFNVVDSNHGEMVAELSSGTSTRIPLLRIEVSGEFLGIEQLVGIPKITSSCDDIDTTSGREEDLTKDFDIKNEGTDRGTFLLSGTCDNSKLNLLLSNQVVIDEDSTNTISGTVTGTAETEGETVTGTCTLKVDDKNSNNEDTCTFGVSIEFSDVICIPDNKYCSNDEKQILQCGEFGDVKDILFETCDEGEKCGLNSDGDIDCITGTPSGNTTTSDGDGDKTPGEQTCLDRNNAGSNRYQWIEKETESGFIFKKTTTESFCRDTWLPFFVIGGISVLVIIIIIILLVFLFKKPKKKK